MIHGKKLKNLGLSVCFTVAMSAISFAPEALAQNATSIDPMRPFGIELGKPMPGNISIEGKFGTDLRGINVPNPHPWFINILNDRITGSKLNDYYYNAYTAALTYGARNVSSVVAKSRRVADGKTVRSDAPTCAQIGQIYNQIRDANNMIEMRIEGRLAGGGGGYSNNAGWQKFKGERYRGKLTSQSGNGSSSKVGDLSVHFICNVGTDEASIHFILHTAE